MCLGSPHPALDHPVLTPSSMPLTMPVSRHPLSWHWTHLMQCPQELSRLPGGWLGSGAGPSLHPEAALAPEAKPGHCHPWVCLCRVRGPQDHLPAARKTLVRPSRRHMVTRSHQARRRGPSSKRAKE